MTRVTLDNRPGDSHGRTTVFQTQAGRGPLDSSIGGSDSGSEASDLVETGAAPGGTFQDYVWAAASPRARPWAALGGPLGDRLQGPFVRWGWWRNRGLGLPQWRWGGPSPRSGWGQPGVTCGLRAGPQLRGGASCPQAGGERTAQIPRVLPRVCLDTCPGAFLTRSPRPDSPLQARTGCGADVRSRLHIFRYECSGLWGRKHVHLALQTPATPRSPRGVTSVYAHLPEVTYTETAPRQLPCRGGKSPPGSVRVCCEEGRRCPLWKFLWLARSLMTRVPDHCSGGPSEESWRDFSGPMSSRKVR